MGVSQRSQATGSVGLIAGILLIAATLRAPITGIAPLLEVISEAFSLGTIQAGALTTLPLLAFALASPMGVLLARKLGLERSLLLALILIAGGIALRAVESVWFLFVGMGIIGIGIAIANVLLPSLVKREFPSQVAAMTSAYALSAGVGAAVASSSAVPLAAGLPGDGWIWSLAAVIIFPLAAIIAWLPQLRKSFAPSQHIAQPQTGRIWHSALAWQVTLFLGLNSVVYYTVTAWLPTILVAAGYSDVAAGSLHGVAQLATAAPGLILAPIISRMRDQRFLALGLAVLTALSLLGLMFAPQLAVLWSAAFGFSAGAVFILALAFLSLRAATSAQAVSLSAMAQLVGYLLAAAAPPLMGKLHDSYESWNLPLGLCVIVCAVMAYIGTLAGRARHVA